MTRGSPGLVWGRMIPLPGDRRRACCLAIISVLEETFPFSLFQTAVCQNRIVISDSIIIILILYQMRISLAILIWYEIKISTTYLWNCIIIFASL